MTNHLIIPINVDISNIDLLNLVHEIIDIQFKKQLHIHTKYYDGGKTLYIQLFLNIGDNYPVMCLWINDNGDIEFEHQDYYGSWWIEGVFTVQICKTYDVKKIYDDGVGWYKSSGVTYHKTYYDYICHYKKRMLRRNKLSWFEKRCINKQIKRMSNEYDIFSKDFIIGDANGS